MLSGSKQDVFEADIFYHQSCYIRILIKPVKLPLKDDSQKNKAKDVLDLFKYRIKTKTKRDKEAYLLHEVLKHIKCLSKGRDRETSVVERTSSLKRYLVEDTLTKLQSSHPKNIYLFTLLISTHVRTVLTFHDCDLKFSWKYFWRKLQERQKGDINWPLTPE